MWEPISQHGSLSDRIVARIEQLIDDERLKPGDQLPAEREVAELLEVSRPSLREAIRILEARGRLLVKHGQGVFVQAPLSERELRAAMGEVDLTLQELYAMREVLEVPAAGWAAENITAEQLGEVRRALDALNAAGERPDPDFDKLRQLDANFHLSIAVAAGNRFLRQTSNVLHRMVLSSMQTTLLIPGRVAIARHDHERIYAALERHDVAGARQAARAHIRGARTAAARRLEREGRVADATRTRRAEPDKRTGGATRTRRAGQDNRTGGTTRTRRAEPDDRTGGAARTRSAEQDTGPTGSARGRRR